MKLKTRFKNYRFFRISFWILNLFLISAPLIYGQETLTVSPDGQNGFVSIQDALDAAIPGQTILVMPGIYRESLVIHTPVKITGYMSKECILEIPQGSPAGIVIMDAAKEKGEVVIQSLTIRGQQRIQRIHNPGVVLEYKNGRSVIKVVPPESPASRANIFSGSYLTSVDGWKIDFPEAAYVIMAGNGRTKAVELETSTGRTSISREMITEARYIPGGWPNGIMVIQSHASIYDCRISDLPGDGIWVGGNESVVDIRNNICSDNKKNGIIMAYGSEGTLSNNTLRDNTIGISVENHKTSPFIYHNFCSGNLKSGIFYTTGATGFAQANQVTDNAESGIFISGGETCPTLIENHCIKNGQDGIHLTDGTLSCISKNNCWRNTKAGILATGKNTKCSVVNNQCRNNGTSGIVIQKGSNGYFAGNDCISNNEYGIDVKKNAGKPVLENNWFEENPLGEISNEDPVKRRKRKALLYRRHIR